MVQGQTSENQSELEIYTNEREAYKLDATREHWKEKRGQRDTPSTAY